MKNPVEEGFSLTEVVVALLVISLGLAGVMQVARMSARSQVRVVDAATTRRAEAQLTRHIEATLRPLEPLSLSRLTATAERLDYDCGAPEPCGFTAPKGYRFRYVVKGVTYERLPPEPINPDENIPDLGRLEAVIVLDKTSASISTVAL